MIDLREKYDNTDQDVDKIQREINDADQIISKSKPEKEKLEKVVESFKEKIKKLQEQKEELSVNHEKILHLRDKENDVWKTVKREISSLANDNQETF